MKTIRSLRFFIVLICLAVTMPFAQSAPLGTAFTYQGRLSDGGNPAAGSYDLKFSLYDAPTAGALVGTPTTITLAPVGVTNGVFTVMLDFGSATFIGSARWLEIAVRTNGSVSPHTTLTPRQPLMPTPYALFASNAATATSLPWSALTGIPAGLADGIDNDTIYSAGSGLTLSGTSFSVNFAGTGTATTVAHSDHNHDAAYWNLGGNIGTSPGANYLGTADNQALEFKVNSVRALRLEPNSTSPNLIAGYFGNSVDVGVAGATISGGGQSDFRNRVTGDFGVVGGGQYNTAGASGTVSGGSASDATGLRSTVGGGFFNIASGFASTIAGGNHSTANGSFSSVAGGEDNYAGNDYASIGGGQNNRAGIIATVGGGTSNIASGVAAFIGGGEQNRATNDYASIGGGLRNIGGALGAAVAGGVENVVTGVVASVGGGSLNRAGGDYSTVSGGYRNRANGYAAMIPGGEDNVADGWDSFAAGDQAKAIHNNTFVWADDAAFGGDFTSTGADQFLIRARGGVGIGTAIPARTLDVRDFGFGDNGSIHVGGTGANGDPKLIYFGDGDFVHIGENGADDRLELKGTTVFMNAGAVGIGTITPTHKLEVNGDVAGVGPYNNISDARFKTNIVPVTDALEKVLRLRGVTHDWRRAEYPEKNFNEGRQLGFIAQEVREVLPEVVSQDRTGYYSIAYSQIIPVLVEAIKEQQKKIDKLVSENEAASAALEKQIAEGQRQLAVQQQANAQWEARFAALEKAMAPVPLVSRNEKEKR